MPCDSCSTLDLPQFGFRSEIEFRRLVERNPFLFRVHSPKTSASPLQDAFTAPKFDSRYSDAGEGMLRDPPPATYADVATHLDWTTRYSSVYISTSFSFMWAIWEALRRYHFGVKHGIEIAVIDATAAVIARRAITAVEVLHSVSPSIRHPDHWKWYHYAQESQSVLVYGAIPQFAVLASSTPSHPTASVHFLPPAPPLPASQLPIARVAWFYPRPPSKASYHNFCVVQSAFFHALSPEARNDDATHGAVRLAMALLGEWAAWMVKLLAVPDVDDLSSGGRMRNAEARNVFSNAALTKVLELAQAIARWPDPEHAAGEGGHERWSGVVQELGQLVSEEIRRMETTGKVHFANDSEVLASPIMHDGDDVEFVPPLDGAVEGNADADWHESKVAELPLDPELPQIASPMAIQRDYSHLPTPPPTPPPSLVSRSASNGLTINVDIGVGDATASERIRTPIQVSHGCQVNSDPAMVVRIDAALEKYIDAVLTPPPSPVLAAPSSSESLSGKPASKHDPEPESASHDSDKAAVAPPHPNSNSNSLPHLINLHLSSYSLTETASCLITGFIFGALIVVVLAQRQPARLYVS
ncbi:hypothetical protein C8F01DRAFT_1164737 [Mycena amicta]|nr:hypothetical protein C8F01DRAFT_1164737 [Mycena amicta]